MPNLRVVLTAILLTCIPVVGRAQEFSADVVYVAPGKAEASGKTPASLHDPSRLYVSKQKMRLETHGITGTVLLVDGESKMTVALFPAQKAYQPLTSAPSEYFHVDDAENACPDWQKVSERKLECEKAGHETIAGRETVKYTNKAATPAAPISSIWIDPKLKFVVKWEDPTVSAELRNIKEETLPVALFDVPDGFGQMRPKKKAPNSKAGAK